MNIHCLSVLGKAKRQRKGYSSCRLITNHTPNQYSSCWRLAPLQLKGGGRRVADSVSFDKKPDRKLDAENALYYNRQCQFRVLKQDVVVNIREHASRVQGGLVLILSLAAMY